MMYFSLCLPYLECGVFDRVPCAHSAVQWAGTDPTVQRSVCATTEASVTLRQDSASAPGASQDTGRCRKPADTYM